MSEEEIVPTPPPLPDGSFTPQAPDRLEPAPPRHVEFFELLVFLLIVGPRLLLSFFSPGQGQQSMGFPLVAGVTIFQDVGLVALVVYFLWRNGEPFLRLGWRRQEWCFDLLLALPFYFPYVLILGIERYVLVKAGLLPAAPTLTLPAFLTARGGGEYALATLMVLVVAVTEETLFRGYLLLRLRSITGNVAVAVFLSSLLFALGHGYQAPGALIMIFTIGVLFSLIYLWRKSLLAPMALHFLQDFMILVIVPLFQIHVQ